MKEYIVHAPKTKVMAVEEYTSFYGEPVEELIRCKDCGYWSANTQLCALFSGLCTAHRMPPNGYCSEAKRKEE